MGNAAADYVAELKRSIKLTDKEEAFLIAGRIRSHAALLGVAYAFPVLAGRLDLDFAKLSNAATRGLQPAARASHQAFLARASKPGLLPTLRYGARPSPRSPVQVGATVPLPPAVAAAPAAGGPLSGLAPADVDKLGWLVRNQANRGTCVSFATTACREFVAFLAGSPVTLDLSEQFFYYAIKQQPGEPWTTTTLVEDDGTTLGFANLAMAATGVCDCSFWSYDQNFIPGNPGQGDATHPSAAAVADAATRMMNGTYADMGQATGRAQAVYDLLASRQRPVAITVPIFTDPTTKQSNWSTSTAWAYGEVIDPLPSLSRTGGHAVAITGFRPDPAESTGGYFIFRNSWAADWGANTTPAPVGQLSSGRAGYGIISATYIDQYLEETLVL